MRRLAMVTIVLLAGCATVADKGLVTMPSAHDVPTTVARFEAAVAKRGLRVFTTVDHAAGARRVDQSLRPTTLMLFGSPRVGTRLMRCSQTAGIDLPLKVLVYEDASGQTFVAYNATDWLSDRHGLGECAGVLDNVAKALDGLATAAAAGEG